MESITIAQLQKKPVEIFNDVIGLFDIYIKFIRPRIILSENFPIYQRLVLAKPTLFIELDEEIQLINSFEVFYFLETINSDNKISKGKILWGQISEAEFCIRYAFYELIDIIVRYSKSLDIELIYKHLDAFLTIEMKQQLFNKKNFSIATFCEELNIHEQTYYKRREKGLTDVNC